MIRRVTALFSMAIGMGVPLLAVGASAGALLPKSGPWMESVKRFFGVILLGVAIYIVAPVLPVSVQMYAWAGLLIFTAVFLKAFDSLPRQPHVSDRVGKALGIVALVAGMIWGSKLGVQFTLAADTRSGNRPSFTQAAPAAEGRALYDHVLAQARAQHPVVACGQFGADMQVHLVNDGPVTIPMTVR